MVEAELSLVQSVGRQQNTPSVTHLIVHAPKVQRLSSLYLLEVGLGKEILPREVVLGKPMVFQVEGGKVEGRRMKGGWLWLVGIGLGWVLLRVPSRHHNFIN